MNGLRKTLFGFGGVALIAGALVLAFPSTAKRLRLGEKLSGPIYSTDSSASPTTADVAAAACTAPEFAAGAWINSEPLTLKDLRGRVVLVEFWTFGCYYCRNTLPFVKKWDVQYREQGLTIVGVHSPEFAH